MAMVIRMFHFLLCSNSYNFFLTQIEIMNVFGSKSIGRIHADPEETIYDVKEKICVLRKSLLPDRQSIRMEVKGKALKDSDVLKALGVSNLGKLYVKDLGPQISWKTVFLVEYAGPLAVYLWMYQRPWLFYGDVSSPMTTVAK